MRRITIFALIIALAIVTTAVAQSPRIPRIQGFVKAFNSGEVDALEAFLQANATPEFLARRPAESRRMLFGRVMSDLGTIEAESVSFDGDKTATIIASAERMEDEVHFALDFQTHDPFLIAGLSINIVPAGSSDLPPLPEVADRKALDGYFAALAADDQFAGTVQLVRDGETLFEGAYGMADRGWDAPNTMSTRFNLGSINKAFTKIVVGQLLAAGKISLDDTLGRHLPDFPHAEAAEKVTIRHLLEHGSGLGDIFVPEFSEANKALLRTDRDYFHLFAERELDFEPGAQQKYSNAGYIVLGEIVSRVSGVPYQEYVRKNIWAPAGMDGAAFAATDEINRNVAVGYTTWTMDHTHEGPLRPNWFMMPVVGMGAGGAVATAADLVAFDDALREHRLLEPHYTEWFFTGILPEEASSSRAAFDLGIAGGGPGVNAILEGDGSHCVVVLANLDPPTAEQLGLALSRAMRK